MDDDGTHHDAEEVDTLYHDGVGTLLRDGEEDALRACGVRGTDGGDLDYRRPCGSAGFLKPFQV